MEGNLHDDLLRGIHEAGMYEFATDVGILQNGELPEVRMHESAWAGETEAPPPPPAVTPTTEDHDLVAQGRALADAAAAAAAAASAAAATARSRASAAAAASAAAGGGGGAAPPPGGGGGRKRGSASLDAADSAGPPPSSSAGGGGAAAAANGKGLRHFSLKVCAAVEAAGATTYNEVADALVADLAASGLVGAGPGALDEKNIRRRVYDALNVLMALGTITKVKKAIRWVGLPLPGGGSAAGAAGGAAAGGGLRRLGGGPGASPALARLRSERDRLRSALERGAATVGELERQAAAFRALVAAHAAAPASGLRARAAAGDAAAPTPLALPFILIHVRPDAPVEVQIAADTRAAAFDFGAAPFRITGAEEVLYAMGLHAADRAAPAPAPAAAQTAPVAAAAAAAAAAPAATTPARTPRPASAEATPAAAVHADDDAMAASPAPVSTTGRATRTSRRSAAAAAAAAAADTTAMDASPYLARGHRGRQQSPAPPACGATSGGPGLAASPRAGAWPVA